MKLKFYLITSLLVILLFHHTKAEDEDDEGGDVPRSCHSYIFDLLTSGIKTALKCIANFKINRITDYSTRAYCILKCVFQEFGTIDAEGQFDAVAASFFFDETFSQEVKDALVPKAQDCFTLTEQFNNEDYWCKTYSPFVNCILKSAIPVILPYIINCYVGPFINIALDALVYFVPDPIIEASVEELKRSYNKQRGVYCLHHNCTTKYRISKTKAGSVMILYHKNMTEYARVVKTPNGFNTNVTAIINQNKNEISDVNDTPNAIINDILNITFVDDNFINSNDTPSINSDDTVIMNNNGILSINNNDTLSMNSDDILNMNNNDTLINSDDTSKINSDDTSKISSDDTSKINSDEIPNSSSNDFPNINDK